MLHFLEVHGVLDAVLKAAAVALFGAVVRTVRKHMHLLKEIADLLRTDTPGGLGEVAARQERLEKALEKPKPAPRARARPKPRSDGEGRG